MDGQSDRKHMKKPSDKFVEVVMNPTSTRKPILKKCEIVENLGFHKKYGCYANRVKDGRRKRIVVRFQDRVEWYWWSEKLVPLGKGTL